MVFCKVLEMLGLKTCSKYNSNCNKSVLILALAIAAASFLKEKCNKVDFN